ncbi:WD40/YVTN/BNR-like repeat-containing protein [Ktedonobacter robiniae]|uniref:Exo-alpha-sialidase n=1 Tax=Ktedonobacter robiniae TaxID=2778365 RepID=A0ABQ3URG5_9CHLR|nr:hypothetical protein [Ktedonobacter robiniae]GHO55384.1 hypothetical protein KSB_38590 [Ktedonobacter robiniae]
MSRSHVWRRYVIASICAALMLFSTTAAYARPVQPHYNHFLYNNPDGDALYEDGPEGQAEAAAQQYDDRAYPRTYIDYTRVNTAYNAHLAVTQQAMPANIKSNSNGDWQLVGPSTPQVAPQATYTGRATVTSGRMNVILVANDCNATLCRVWVGAAGGGIWSTENGLAAKPNWTYSSDGLSSNAIGSIVLDPNDHSGRTLYAGTGEQNGSSDSEAGVGLFKSTDYGKHWKLVEGSVPAAKDRAISSVAVDPTNAKHIYIGTAVARHGSSAVNGGRFTPPHAPVVGLYESLDGGKTFKLVFSKESDTVDPSSPNGNDFFRGGVSKVLFYHQGATTQVYFSVFDYGVYRSNNGSFEQVFASAGQGTVANSSLSRTEFALAPNGNKLRIYVGDSGSSAAQLYRVDDANVPASTLTNGTANPGWLDLSSQTPGTPGYSSYNYCGGQCTYDMPVESPAGHPDTVWIGGQMQYDEIFTTTPPSNGRAVQRSTNAGVSFTDMTNDTQNPPLGMHPDQHVIAFAPSNPDIAFLGSDGGIVRTSGQFADTSSDCANRGISGTDLTDCQAWLKAIPTRIYSLNDGLSTLQFQSLSVNPKDPKHDLIGGTQDNGTFASTPSNLSVWTQTVGGDGGNSVIDAGNPTIRMHTYYGPNGDVNFRGNDPNGWDYWADPLFASGEAASFYVPLIGDPKVSQTMFVGLEHVWRTQDSGGPQAYMDQHCNEITGDFTVQCGDWVPLGPNLVDSTFGTDKGGSYVVALKRAPSDTGTLWAATRRGRLFISTNANAPAANVTYTRIDTSAQPNRFISGIAVDPKDKYHAYISFSGYDAYTPNTTGHVFDVHYNPATGKASWKDISANLGDQPITNVAYDSVTGNLYVATDFGVDVLRKGSSHWRTAAKGLPMVAVYSLTISESGRVLYAATHGRSAWRLNLSND